MRINQPHNIVVAVLLEFGDSGDEILMLLGRLGENLPDDEFLVGAGGEEGVGGGGGEGDGWGVADGERCAHVLVNQLNYIPISCKRIIVYVRFIICIRRTIMR